MMRGYDIAVNKVSAAPLPVRAADAVRAPQASSSEPQADAVSERAPEPEAPEREPQVFRYNSFEFRYRQDVGRIVLIGQSPETGERVVQVPSETALRAYVQRLRAEKQETATEVDLARSTAERGRTGVPAGGDATVPFSFAAVGFAPAASLQFTPALNISV